MHVRLTTATGVTDIERGLTQVQEVVTQPASSRALSSALSLAARSAAVSHKVNVNRPDPGHVTMAPAKVEEDLAHLRTVIAPEIMGEPGCQRLLPYRPGHRRGPSRCALDRPDILGRAPREHQDQSGRGGGAPCDVRGELDWRVAVRRYVGPWARRAER